MEKDATRKPEADVSTEKLPPPSWMTSAKQPPQDHGQEICQRTFHCGLFCVSVDVGAAEETCLCSCFNQKHHFQVPPVKSAWGARSSQRMTMDAWKQRRKALGDGESRVDRIQQTCKRALYRKVCCLDIEFLQGTVNKSWWKVSIHEDEQVWDHQFICEGCGFMVTGLLVDVDQ